jgi:hypothetical protein
MTEHEMNTAALTDGRASTGEAAPTPSGVVTESIHRTVVNGQEAWVRASSEPRLRSVEAVKNDSGGGWSVSVAALKIVHPEHAVCRALREAIEDAIEGVPGVSEVEHEANEVWWASGYPSGKDLTSAVAHVIDRYADRLRHRYDRVEPGSPPPEQRRNF